MPVHHTNILVDILLLLGAAVFIVAIFRRLNLSPVLGYLAVGGLVGPFGLGVIEDPKSTEYLAEFGVVFLLFAIGLELTLDRLISMRKAVFGFGSLQVLFCGSIMAGITYLISKDFNIAFVAGFVFALSSTAVILQVLTEKGQEMTQYGRLSIATLILQDLAFVPLLIMIPLLANQDGNIFMAVGESLLKGMLVLIAIVIIGKRILGPIYKMVAQTKSQELFIALTLLVLLGCAALTEVNGLSLALGAFIAGLLIAETEYRTQVETDLKPFKGILMGFFFISVGMRIDYNILSEKAVTIIALTCSIIAIKSLVIYFLARSFNFGKSCALKASLTLAQVSEFAFVLFPLAEYTGVLPTELSQIFIVAVSISMALTPLLNTLAEKFSKKLELKNPAHMQDEDIEKEVFDLHDHVIVIGFGRVGKTTCQLLRNRDIQYVVLEDDIRNVHQGRKEGFPVFFGKCNLVGNLHSLGVERAKMVVITTGEMKDSLLMTKSIRKKYPSMRVIVRAKDRIYAKKLRKVGATITIAEAFESSLMIGNFILTSIGVSDSEVEKAVDEFRAEEHPESQLKGVLYKSKEDVTPI
jgi:CPA2 family monovalent cation:H+ antiporter-2